MKTSLKNYCYFITNEGMVELSVKDYINFAILAVSYSVKMILNKLLS